MRILRCETCGNDFDHDKPGRRPKQCPACRPAKKKPGKAVKSRNPFAHELSWPRKPKPVPNHEQRRRGPPPRPERELRMHLETSPGYADEEREFIVAVDRYKRERKQPFPSYTEILAVAKGLGYRKVAPATPFDREPPF